MGSVGQGRCKVDNKEDQGITGQEKAALALLGIGCAPLAAVLAAVGVLILVVVVRSLL